MEKETLTNELIRKKCASQFELVNYAIRLAEYYIKSGKELENFYGKNPALQVISAINDKQETLREIPEILEDEEEEDKGSFHSRNDEKENVPHSNMKTGEKKKLKVRLETW
jgi:hypothetical protein